MASYYWAKVWIEILGDPPVAQLPDHIWRRWIEVILMAKDKDMEGALPSVADMAWRLRSSHEGMEEDVRALEFAGLIELRGGTWYVINFVKRQAAMPGTERTRRSREKKRKDTYYGDQTRIEWDPETSEERSATPPVTDRHTDQAPGAAAQPEPPPPSPPASQPDVLPSVTDRYSGRDISSPDPVTIRHVEERRGETEEEKEERRVAPVPVPLKISPGPPDPEPKNQMGKEEIAAWLASPDPELLKHWTTLRTELQAAAPTRQIWDDWLNQLQPLAIKDHEAWLYHPTTYGADWCSTRLDVLIDRTVRAIIPGSMGSAIVTDAPPGGGLHGG